MGLSSPPKQNKKALLRFLLPFIVSVVLFITPIVTQMIVYFAQDGSSLVAKDAVVDVSSREVTSFQNVYIKGEIELFYNQWIISEPQEDAHSIRLNTPSRWTSKINYDGESLPSSGYASYRFFIKGLTPGQRLYAHPNIDIHNRIYLQGTLVSAMGIASKEQQSTFVDLSLRYTDFIIVPESGNVEYVMEVGDTGDGGASHIGLVYVEGYAPFSLTNRYIASIALGFIFASSLLLFVLLRVSSNKKLTMLLTGSLIGVGLLYLVSRDSFFVGAALFFSAPLFDTLSVLFLGIVISLLLVYLAFQRNNPLKLPELLALIAEAGMAATFYMFGHGTGFEWIVLIFMVSIPIYTEVKACISHFKGKRNDSFLIVNSMVCAFGVLMVLFASNALSAPLVTHPTIFSLSITLAIFAAGFYEIYHASIAKRDLAALEQRQRDITNRALAKLSSQAETIETLKMIDRSYDVSLREGDKRLLGFSSLMRKRLIALREETITLEKECELESELVDLRNSISERQVTLLLDVERGDLMVPPLIFEEAISLLSEQIQNDGYITISETKRGAKLSYPEGLSLDIKAKQSIKDRCFIAGIETKFSKDSILIWRRKT